MTSNYSEGLGNIASVQKVYKNRKVYSIRSRESMKNAIMVQSGMYDDLQPEIIGVSKKKVNQKRDFCVKQKPHKKRRAGQLSPASMKKKIIYVKKRLLYLLINIPGICDKTVIRS